MNKIELKFAASDELGDLQSLRYAVFVKELAIQSENYQDVFNDYYAKNIVLKVSGKIVGAIRMVFHRERQQFYLSYFLLHPSCRKLSYARLLIGAVFYVMRVNHIEVIFADAWDQVLPLYEKFGCVILGDKFYKHGFICAWTPMKYVLGKNPEFEEKSIAMGQKYLEEAGCLWNIYPKIIVCQNLKEFKDCFNYLVKAKNIFHTLPFLLESQEKRLLEKLQKITIADNSVLWSVYSATLYLKLENIGNDFEYYNETFSEENIVFCQEESDLLVLAKCYAIITSKKLNLVKNWSDINVPQKCKSVILFLENKFSNSEFYSWLRVTLKKVSWGIISGDSLTVISWMVLKNYLHYLYPVEGLELLLLPLSIIANHNNLIEPVIYERRNLDIDTISEKLKNGKLKVLSILSHGRGDIIYYSNIFYFCGRSTGLLQKQEKDSIKINCPCCLYQNGCYKGGQKFLAHQMNAQLIFINSCFTFANCFPKSYTIGWSFLRSMASHVIGSERAKNGHYLENTFYLCLIKEGFSFGDALRHLNKALMNFYCEPDCYLLFGDPTLRIYPAQYRSYSISINKSESVKLLVKQHDSNYVIHLALDSSSITFNDTQPLFIYSTLDYKLSYFYYSEYEKIHLFLFSIQKLPPILEIYFFPRTTVEENFSRIQFYLDNCRTNRFFGLFAQKNKLLSTIIEDNSMHLAKLYAEGRSDLYCNYQLLAKCDGVLKKIDNMDLESARHILNLLVNKGWFIEDDYQNLFSIERYEVHNRCYICGDLLYLKIIKHSVLNHLLRYNYNCATCGIIGDVPAAFSLPRFIGNDVYHMDKINSQIVEIINPFAFKITGYLGVRLYQSKDYQITYLPEVMLVEIPPHSTKQWEFQFVLGHNLPKHRMFLKAVAIIHGSILYTQKNILIS